MPHILPCPISLVESCLKVVNLWIFFERSRSCEHFSVVKELLWKCSFKNVKAGKTGRSDHLVDEFRYQRFL
jgi:hypothetical protein